MGKGRGRAVVSHPGAEDQTDALKHLIIIQMTGAGRGGEEGEGRRGREGRLTVSSQTRTSANVTHFDAPTDVLKTRRKRVGKIRPPAFGLGEGEAA